MFYDKSTDYSITLPLGRTIIVKPIWTCFYCLIKNLKSENPVGQKPNKREKEYSALNVHIAPSEKNNFNLAAC